MSAANALWGDTCLQADGAIGRVLCELADNRLCPNEAPDSGQGGITRSDSSYGQSMRTQGVVIVCKLGIEDLATARSIEKA